MTKENGWITNIFGNKLHYKNDVLHREDGPAIMRRCGTKVWCINGKFHNEHGPAIIRSNGDKLWWINDNLHRTDGPAIVYSDGNKEWYINNIKYSFKEYCSILKLSSELITKLTLKYNL